MVQNSGEIDVIFNSNFLMYIYYHRMKCLYHFIFLWFFVLWKCAGLGGIPRRIIWWNNINIPWKILICFNFSFTSFPINFQFIRSVTPTIYSQCGDDLTWNMVCFFKNSSFTCYKYPTSIYTYRPQIFTNCYYHTINEYEHTFLPNNQVM